MGFYYRIGGISTSFNLVLDNVIQISFTQILLGSIINYQ